MLCFCQAFGTYGDGEKRWHAIHESAGEAIMLATVRRSMHAQVIVFTSSPVQFRIHQHAR